jgi:hypothetical protein
MDRNRALAHPRTDKICQFPRHTFPGYDWLAWGNQYFRKPASGDQYQDEETEFHHHC